MPTALEVYDPAKRASLKKLGIGIGVLLVAPEILFANWACRPVESPRAAESLDIQAAKAALKETFNLLSSSQRRDFFQDGRSHRVELTSTIVNQATNFPLDAIAQGKSVTQDRDGNLVTVMAEYIDIETMGSTIESKSVNRMSAGIEIKNFKIVSVKPSPLTDADRANNLDWQGSIAVGFIYRTQYVVPRFRESNYNLQDHEIDLLKNTTLPKPTVPLSDWRDETFHLKLNHVNGEWRNQQIAHLYPIAIYNNIYDMGNQCPSKTPPYCQIVIVPKTR